MTDLSELSEPLDHDAAEIVSRAGELFARLKALGADAPEAGRWLRMWLPVGGALLQLGSTLSRLALRLRQPGDEDLLPPEVRDELWDDLQALAEAFPDITSMLFGLTTLDDLADSTLRNDEVRGTAQRLLQLLEHTADRLIDRLFDIVLGQRDSPVHADDVIAWSRQLEALAQRLLDELLRPTFRGDA